MKKIFSSVVMALGFIAVASAQDLAIKPAIVSPGEALGDNYLEVTFDRFDANAAFANWQFDIHVNKALTLTDDDNGDDVDLEGLKGAGTNVQKKAWSYTLVDFGESPYGADMKMWRVTIYNTKSYCIPASALDGAIMGISYSSASDLSAGIYPIYMDCMSFATNEDGLTKYELANTTSYIKVGTPSNATLAVEGILPSFVTSALPAGMTVDLTKCTDIYGSCSNNVTVKSTRSAKWGTVCMPVALTSDANIQYYSVESIASDAVTVKAVANVAAGTPAIYCNKAEGSATISGTGAISTEVNTADNLVGVMKDTKVTEAGTYYLKDNKFYSINDNFNVAAFKAYLKTTTAGAAIRDIEIEDATAIKALNAFMNGEYEAIYNTNGVRQNDLQKGVNIVKLSNGKTQKIIVK